VKTHPPLQADLGELLERDDVRSILSRLIEGDPLELSLLANSVVSTETLMVHPARLAARTSAQLAFRAFAGDRPSASVLTWLQRWTRRCLEDLIEEDVDAEQRRAPLSAAELEEFSELVPSTTGIEPQLSRLAAVLFNRYRSQDRLVFYRCAIEGFSIPDAAREAGLPARATSSRIQSVTERLISQVAAVRQRRGDGR